VKWRESGAPYSQLPESAARVDFRDHINKFDQSTVNNMELSLGLFTRF